MRIPSKKFGIATQTIPDIILHWFPLILIWYAGVLYSPFASHPTTEHLKSPIPYNITPIPIISYPMQTGGQTHNIILLIKRTLIGLGDELIELLLGVGVELVPDHIPL